MPAKRLPWFKFWPEAMRHEKVALLLDGLFRTWVAMLSDGSTQPVRWRFASAKHAAAVTGRPLKHIRDLISARLLDESANGEVWVHDWRQWQDRYESDFAPRRLREDSIERSALSLTDTEERRERRDTERELVPEPYVSGELDVAGGAGGAAVAAHGAIAPPKTKTGGREPKTLAPKTLEPNDTDYAAGTELGMTEADVERCAAAMLDHFRAKGELRADWHATLRTWVRNAAKFDQPRAPNAHRNGSSKPPPKRPGPPIPAETSGYFQTRTGTLPRR